MNDKRRQDPLRRTPPTIDLKAEIVPSKGDKPASDAAPEEGASAIEDVASTALGAEASKKAEPAPQAKPTPPTEPAPKTAEPAKPAPAKASDAASKSAAAGAPAASAPAKPGDTKPAEPTKPASDTASKAGEAKAPATASVAAAAKPGDPTTAKPDATVTKPVVSSTSGAAVPGVKPTEPSPPKPADSTKPGEPAKPAEATTKPSDGPAKPTEAAKTARESTPASTPVPPPARVGAGTILTAGFIGGLLGALLAVGLMQILPRDRTADDRLAQLERQFAALPKGPGALEPRVAALETGVKQAGDEAKAAARQAAEALGRPTGVQGPDQEARTGLRSLTTRVDESAARTATTVAAVGDLGQKLEALGRATSDRFTSVAKDAETFATHQKSLQADVALLRTGATALESRSVEADKRLTALTDGLGRVSSDLARVSPAALQAGLRIIVSGRLDDALRNGAPLGAPLSALAKLGTDAATLAPLKPFADNAAPSAAVLLGEFKPLAVAMTTEPTRQDEGWFDKGRRVLGKVVSVESVGDGSGGDVPGLIARIETNLGRGDIAAAKAAFDRLPEDKRRLAAAWGEKLGQRVAAEEAVRRVSTQSLSALDAATR